MKWYLNGFKKYAVFTGRARRKEYWMWTLFNVIIGFGLAFLDDIIGSTFKYTTGNVVSTSGYMWSIYTLIVLIPNISIAVRRLHDIGKSAWMLLVILIPFGGAVWLIVLMCKNGMIGENRYGGDPKVEGVVEGGEVN